MVVVLPDRRHRGQVDFLVLGAQQFDQVVVHDFDNHLTGRDGIQDRLADRLLLHGRHERLHDRQRNVGLQQGDAHVAQCAVHIAFPQGAAPGQALEDLAQAAA